MDDGLTQFFTERMGSCTSRSQDDSVLLQILKEQGTLLKEIKEQGTKIDRLQATTATLSVDVKELNTIVNLPTVNPWHQMTRTDRSRAKNLRTLFESAHKNMDPSFDIGKCWLTGESNTKVAHIIPDSADHMVLEKLGLSPEFKNGLSTPPYNFLLLTTPVEEAFDSLVCSFIPVSVFYPSTFKLCVWNKTKAAKIVVGTKTLLDYHDSQLNIPPYWVVSRRSLSYHALCAYYTYRLANPDDENTEPLPSDFSSDHGDKDATREWLLNFFETSMREEKQEEEDNMEDEA